MTDPLATEENFDRIRTKGVRSRIQGSRPRRPA